jgi:hypothetical protein
MENHNGENKDSQSKKMRAHTTGAIAGLPA